MKPVVALTLGDFNGVGPEIALLAATDQRVRKACRPVLVGPLDIFENTAKHMRKRIPLEKAAFPALPGKGIPVVDTGEGLWIDVTYGEPTKASGKTAGQALEKAIELCMTGNAHAMVTGPVSKHALHMAGYTFPGQTEFVTMLSRSQRVLMMMVSKKIIVGLVTVHVPVREVTSQITREKVQEKISVMSESLRKDFGRKKPKIAVLGLNPHAGELGDIGTEEQDVIRPAIDAVRSAGTHAEGPFPADAYFGKKMFEHFDGTLAMFHDQGLVASKLLSFGTAVNMSAGLPIVRTSPDHGTAYDIAGKRKADPSSFLEAVLLAVRVASKRRRS